MVTPDLRHARKLGLLPGASAVMRMIAAPGLEKWKREQAVLAALTLPRIADESSEAFLKRVDEDGKAHARQRAAEGTAIHKAIEQFLRGETYDVRWHAHVAAVLKYLEAQGDDFVGDFKSKESFEGKTERDLFYDDHIMQLASYKRGLVRKLLEGNQGVSGRRFRCETTFGHHLGYGGRVDVHTPRVSGGALLVSIIISVKEPGDIMCRVWSQVDEERGLRMFDNALDLWKAKMRYESGWT